MRKVLFALLIASFCIFLIGIGLDNSNNSTASDVGRYMYLSGSCLLAIFSILIGIQDKKTKRYKKTKQDKTNEENEKNTEETKE